MKKIKIFITTIMASALVVLGLCLDGITTKAYEKTSDLFVSSDNITVKDNSSVPTILKDKDGNDVQTTFDKDLNGVLLTSSKQGASVDFAQKISGSFETTFRVYSDTHYYEKEGSNDWNSSKVTINPYCDLEEFTITFTADNGQTFDIVIAGGEKYNTVTTAARVRMGSSEFGYHYLNDAVVPNDTSLKNSGGYFTRIGGTTFSNVTRRGGALTTDSVPVTIGYNAETMEVYCYHYGITKYYNEAQKQYRVIADLDSQDFGLNKIDSFDNYKVSFSFESIAANKTAKAIIYSINGQSLAGDSLVNSIGPNTIAEFKTNSVSGKKYIIPTPITFDLLEDAEFKTVVNVKDVNGNDLPLYSKSGEAIEGNVYSEGCYIMPNDEGNITFTYTSYDSDNLAGKTANYTIYNFQSEPLLEFDFEGLEQNYQLTNKGVGDELVIYPCEVQSELYLEDGIHYSHVSLYKNDEIYKEIEAKVISELETLKLEEAGSYKLVYFIDGFYNEDYSYEFTVSDTTPSVVFTENLADKYIYGSKLDIPTANYTLNGTTKKATAILYDPTGKQVNISEDTVLDKIGTYKLTYMVRFDDTYSFDYYFAVVHSSNGLFEESKGITAVYGDTGNLFNNKVNGIVVTSTRNDATIKYNKVLDLSKNTKDDSLIELITIPSEIGTLDAYQYTIRLTDIYDEKNYVSIVIYYGMWGYQWSYIKVGSSDQVPSGLEMGKVLTAYNTGTPVNYSMTGEAILGCEVLQLYYDNEEKGIYVDNIKRTGYSYGNLIIDMDNPSYFSEKSLWEGFTTGEVYLSLSVQNIQEEQAQVLIKSINGVSFKSEWIKDDAVPVLTVNTLDYEQNNLPKALVNYEYPIFNAKAYDALDGVIDYTVSVYKDYQTVNQQLITNSKDTFIPTEAGNYSIVYIATDSSKNSTSQVLNIVAVDKLEEIKYQFDGTIPSALKVGETFEIPSGTAIGGSGNVDVEITILDPTGSNVSYENNKVFIGKAGVYTLKVKLVDYLGIEKVIEYPITTAISENPIIGEFSFNNTMIEGYEYDLSAFNALDYFSNNGTPVEALKSIEIVQGGKTTTLDSTFKYTPVATTNNEEITIRFIAKANSGSGEAVLEAKAKIIKLKDSENNYNLANLFYQENIKEVIPADKYVEYVTETDGALLEYVNYLVADGFSMNFTVNKEKNNFGAIEILLQDSQNANQQVLLTIYNSGVSTSSASINEIKNLSITSDFNQTTAYGFKFYFNAKSNAIIDGNTNKSISVVKHNLDGSEFVGFTSGKVKVSIRFVKVEGESSIRVSTISNQALTEDSRDRIAPAVQVMGEINSIGEINEEFTVYRAVASDGVDPNPELTVKIVKDGQTIYSGDISKDYKFVPNSYGEYTIIYTAVDVNNRKTNLTYILTIKDRIKPELVVNGEVMTSAKVGESYTLPSATVTDNNDTDLPVYVFILAPDGEQRANPIGDYTFNPTLKGNYKITYYVQDSYNCYTYVEYIVNVK